MELLIWLTLFGAFILLGLCLAAHALYSRNRGQGASSGLLLVRHLYIALAVGVATFMAMSMILSPLMVNQLVRSVLQVVALAAAMLASVQTFRVFRRDGRGL